MSYEKDQLEALAGSGFTSASASAMIASQIATAVAPLITSASVSSALTAAVAPYVTSNSLSTALAAVQPKTVLLGSISISAGLGSTIGFSGSWSDYYMLEMHVSYRTNGTSNTASVAIYTDGGTTPILSITQSTVSNGVVYRMETNVLLGAGYKALRGQKVSDNGNFTFNTATANTGFVNAIKLLHGTAASATISSGVAMLIGYLR